jgi:metallo-beta-lactamase family protein
MTDTNTSHPFKITFCSGAGTVTGANFLIEADGKKLLVDCGMIQGESVADKQNWDPFPYDSKTIDALFITHCHIDHIGRIPKLIDEGFEGVIYSTPPTKELTYPMLEDTAGIVSKDKDHGLDKIYTEDNIKKAMSLWKGYPYHEVHEIAPDFTFRLLDAGHVLGSSMIEFTFHGKKIVFTGDLGNSPSPILCDTDKLEGIDYLVMESVYGDRKHEGRDERQQKLQEAIQDNYKRKGVLVMPTFSLERSQELLYEMNTMVENDRIPRMPVYFDSPLGIKLTVIFKKYAEYFNPVTQADIRKEGDIFSFPGLRITEDTQQSKEIIHIPNPKMIIAGSGMSNGGRIVHHELNYLPDPNNTILLIGYQSQGTLGRHIEDGESHVTIMHENVDVRAHVVKIDGYSGHKDTDALTDFVADTADTLKKVFVVMGEPKSSLFLVQKLRDFLGVSAVAPDAGTSVTLDC